MVTTALSFKGRAEEALNFYAEVFGYEIKPAEDVWKWENGSIAHAELTIYGNRLMLADDEKCDGRFAGFSLSINLKDEVELRSVHAKLSDGAIEMMPLSKVEWSECYGLLRDKFGVLWQFNLD